MQVSASQQHPSPGSGLVGVGRPGAGLARLGARSMCTEGSFSARRRSRWHVASRCTCLLAVRCGRLAVVWAS